MRSLKDTYESKLAKIIIISTRNAVETAIDLTKGDRTKTWEYLARHYRGRIATYDEIARSK